MTKFYTHSQESEPPEKWQPLNEHLENVAEKAATFAKPSEGDVRKHAAIIFNELSKAQKSFVLFRIRGLYDLLRTKRPVTF